MFTKLKQFITKVGVMVGIIKELDSIKQLKKINISESYYQKIIQWKELHKGYESGIHCVGAYSIEKGNYERDLESLNMPKVVTQELSNLIFNERARVSITASNGFGEFVEDVFKRSGFNGNFQQYLEFMFAQGGMAIKPYINGDKIDLSYSTAETFIPISWDNDKVREALFPSYFKKDKYYYTLLEWHTFNAEGRYNIKNELYRSDQNGKLGIKVSLSEVYQDLTEEVIFSEQVVDPLFVYFKPNTANNLDTQSPLGISIYANSYSTLKLIDTIYDSFLREYKLGRKRIIVNTSAVNTVVNKSNGRVDRFFNAQDETFEALNGGLGDDNFIKEIDSTLRIQEHVDGLNAALDTLSLQIGFSPGTFSFTSSGGLKTATEVVSENSKTFRTKKGHENLIEQRIADLVNAIAILADEAGLIVASDDIEVTVTFDDSIIQDRDAEEDREIKLIAAGLQSKVDAIMSIYGLTEDEALDKLQKIEQERRLEMPDVETLRSSLTLGGQFE